jgi:HlyD family secretion protein
MSVLDSEQRRNIVFLQLLLFIVSVFEVIGIASVAPFMAVASRPAVIHESKWLIRAYDAFGFLNTNHFLIALGLLSVGLLILGNVITLITKWYLTRYGLRLGSSLGERLFASYLEKDYLFHTRNNSAVLTKNVAQEIIRVTNNILIEALNLNSKAFSVVLIAVALFLVNFKATLLIGGALGFCYIAIYMLIKRKLKSNGESISHLLAKSYQTIHESFGGIKEIKISGKSRLHIESYKKTLREFEDLMVFNSNVPAVPKYIIEMISMSGVILLIVFEIRRGHSLDEVLPTLSLFAMAGLRLMPALQQIFASLTTMRSTAFAFNLIYQDLLSSPARSREAEQDSGAALPPITSGIRVDGISFSYPAVANGVFDGLSLEIVANSFVAVVGPSGSGKSTLIDLLLGLLKPNSGRILIDGKDIFEDRNLKPWQRSIGYVPQSVFLLDSTIAANIAFSLDPDRIDMKRVKAAASLALLDEMIESKPKKYGTLVGERGVQLSGGQRQRVAIARALYHDPSVLVFDEATGALDAVTEREVLESIHALAHKKTIVLITHRLSTARKCDRIFVLKNGKVSDSGSYQELTQRNDLFRQMADA